MKLSYSLVENKLQKDGSYRAVVTPWAIYNQKDFYAYLESKGTGVTRTDIKAAVELIVEATEELTSQGIALCTPIQRTDFSITGKFISANDTFDSKRHQLNVNSQPTPAIRKGRKKCTLTKEEASIYLPKIDEAVDVLSGKTNLEITPGGALKIFGSNIKIEGSDNDLGVWFVSDTGDQVKVDIFIENMPSKVYVVVPSLPSGDYTLKIITQYSGGVKPLVSSREGTFNKALTVV